MYGLNGNSFKPQILYIVFQFWMYVDVSKPCALMKWRWWHASTISWYLNYQKFINLFKWCIYIYIERERERERERGREKERERGWMENDWWNPGFISICYLYLCSLQKVLIKCFVVIHDTLHSNLIGSDISPLRNTLHCLFSLCLSRGLTVSWVTVKYHQKYDAMLQIVIFIDQICIT